MSDIVLKVSSDSSQARQDLTKLTNSVNAIEKTTANTTKALAGLASSVAATFAAFSAVRAITKASDSFINLENKIALVVGRTRELVKVQEELITISQRARGSLQDSAAIFSQFGKSLKDAGVSTSRLLNATENVQKAIALSGSSAESAQAAIIQLGQGLASGTLRGEELNSVLEQAPRIAKAIADGLGVSIGQLRKLGEQGALTSDQVFEALLSQTEKINKEFETLSPTFDQATTRLGDGINRLLAQISQSTGISNALGGIVVSIAEKVEYVADTADAYIFVFQSRFRESVQDVRLLGLAVIGLAKVVGQQFAAMVPVIRTFSKPLVAIANSLLFDSIRNSFDKFYASMFTARQEVRGLVEAMGAFVLFGDSRVVRTIGDIFRSDSIVELTANINKLKEGLDPSKLFNFLSIQISLRDKFIRPFYEATAAMKSLGAAVGLVRNPLIEFSYIRIDRFIEMGIHSAQLFVYTLEAIVFPAVIKFGTYVAEFVMNSVEIIRSLLGIGPSFLQVIERSSERIFVALGLMAASSLYVDRVAGALTGALTIFQSVPEGIYNAYLVASKYFQLMIATIISKTKLLDVVENRIMSFVKKVKEFFFDAYDAVVGHSYWPDLVEGVLNWADHMYKEGTKKVFNFTKFVGDSFESLRDKLTALNFEKITSDMFSRISAKFDRGNVLDALGNIGEFFRSGLARGKEVIIEAKLKFSRISVSELLESINMEDLTTAVKRIGTALFVGTLLAIASPKKFALLASAVAISLEAAIAQKLTEGLYDIFGMDFFREVGDTLGFIVGQYFNKLLNELPNILRNIVSFADAFGHAFLQQFGVIGNAISSLISEFSFGSVGLLGLFLFGGGITGILSKVDMTKGALGSLVSSLNSMTGGAKESGGLLGQAFLGPNFKYTLGAITAIVAGFSDQMSLAAGILAATPLLTVAILGEDVTGKIIRDSISKVIGYFIKESLAAAAVLSKTKLATAIFGEAKAGDISKKIESIKDTATKIIKNINNEESRKSYLEGKTSLSDLLFGADESSAEMKQKFDKKVSQAGDIVKSAAAKFGQKIKDLGTDQSIIDKVVSGNPQETVDKVNKSFDSIKEKMKAFMTESNAMAGASGVFGKFFANKAAVIGTLLAALTLFSTQAKAAETEVSSATNSIVDSVTSFLGDYGIYALLLPPGAWNIVFKTFRSAISAAGTLISVFSTTTATAASAATATVGLLGKGLPGLLAALSTASALALKGITLLGSGLLSVFSLATAAISFAVTAVNALLAATLRFLATPVGILLTGIVVGAGILSTYLFGEGDGFLNKLDDVIKKLGKIFSFKDSRQKQLEKLLPDTTVGEQTISFKRQIGSINYDKLNERQFKNLETIAKRTSEVLKKAQEEEEEFGKVTAETADELSKLQNKLSDSTTKYSFNSTVTDLKDSLEAAGKEARSLFLFINRDMSKGFKLNLDKENLLLPFESTLDRYTQFNDARARDLNRQVEETSLVFAEFGKYLKPDEIQRAVTGINQMTNAMDKLSGFSGILERIFPGSFKKEREELQRARDAVSNLTLELGKTGETRAKVKAFKDELTSLQKGLAEFDIKVDLKDLFTLQGEGERLIIKTILERIKELKKNLEEDVYDEVKALEIQQEIDILIQRAKTTIDEGKVRSNLSQSIEDAIKLTGFSVDLGKYIKYIDKDKLQKSASDIDLFRGRINQANEDIKKAKSVEELAAAFDALDKATKSLNNTLTESLGDKAEKTAIKLGKQGVTVASEVLRALGDRATSKFEALSTELENLSNIQIDPNATEKQKQAAARRSLFLKDQIQKDAKIEFKTFSEAFSDQLSKGNLSADLMKVLMLNPSQQKVISNLILESVSTKKLMDGMARTASGLPVNPQQAARFAAILTGNNRQVESILEDVGLTAIDRLNNAIQKSGSKVDLSDLLKLGSKDILAFYQISEEIRNLEKQKAEVGRGKETLLDADLQAVADLDKQITELRKKQQKAAPTNLFGNIEALGNKTGISFGREMFSTLDAETMKGMENISNQMDNLLAERARLSTTKGGSFTIVNPEAFRKNEVAIKELVDQYDTIVNGQVVTLAKKAGVEIDSSFVFARTKDAQIQIRDLLTKIITDQQELDAIKRRSKLGELTEEEQKRFTELTFSIRGAKRSLEEINAVPMNLDEALKIATATGLGKDTLLTNPKLLDEVVRRQSKISSLSSELKDIQLAGLGINQQKVQELLKEESALQNILSMEKRRLEVRDNIMSAGQDLVKKTITGEGGRDKAFMDSLSATILNAFSGAIADKLFTGFANNLSKVFGADLGILGELGSTAANAMWVQFAGGLTGSTGVTGGSSLLSSIGGGLGGLLKSGSQFLSGLFSPAGSLAENLAFEMDWLKATGGLAFADGGVVPGGPGAVPVIAHAGEVILNEAQQARVAAAMNKQEQVFNINVTGDISRQTKTEIMQMLPQIANGVNSYNRENNIRR